MNKVIDLITNVNFCYLILNVLIFVVGNLYLKKNNINRIIKIIFNICYIMISIFSFNYLNGIIESIFRLKYLSVKLYLLIIAGTNLIILYTINTKIKTGYKIINYLLFIILTIIFGSTIAVLLGNRFDALYVMDVSNAINFIDLSFVIFIVYLIIISIFYIGYYLFDNHDICKEEKSVKKSSFDIKKLIINNIKKKQKEISIIKKEKKNSKLTEEELLNYKHENGFYINGVECSIIFEDSNQQNIITNYNILLEDINARLVNGYTLEENQMLKSICTKLRVNNLSTVDITNMSILNKISIEEYDLLKKVLG